MSMRRAAVLRGAGFSVESLERRRAASRRLGMVLAAATLILYVGGFWLQR